MPLIEVEAVSHVYGEHAGARRVLDDVTVRLAEQRVGVIGANGGPRSPGTAYILLHHCMGGVAGHRGLWGFVRGGMGAVSEAIAASARAHGAEIVTVEGLRATDHADGDGALHQRNAAMSDRLRLDRSPQSPTALVQRRRES